MNQMQHDFVGSPVAARDYGPILGTPFKVFLSKGVSEYIDPVSGEAATEIADLPGLIAAIVQARALHPRKLSGADLKYIRSALCMKSYRIAKVLELTPEHYSRCETGTKTLSADKEKFYRMSVYLLSCLKDKDIIDKMSKEKAVEECVKSSPEKAEKAVSAFLKIFLGIKIDPVHSVGEELAFSFFRCSRPDDKPHSGGDDETAWHSDVDRAA